MPVSRQDWPIRPIAFVVTALAVVQFGALTAGTALIPPALAAKKQRPPAVTVETDPDKLPVPVQEMRDAILAAARSGKIEELRVPIQWNELKPDFGDIDSREPIPTWKKLSIDGEGREILAILINLLEAPYAVTRTGRDIENNKIYVWPYFAELPIDKLPPHLETQLLRLIPAAEFKAMKAAGKYTYWRMSIGADGTWHSFNRTTSPPR